MVQGNFAGSAHLSAPVATNSWGTFFSFRDGWIAVFDGVPRLLKMNDTPSFSTSLRTCSTDLGGLYESSRLIKLILRPLMPPFSLTILMKPCSVLPITP